MSEIPTVKEIRIHFEEMVKSSNKFKDSTPLGTMTVNDEFHHYMNPDTDTMWIGFACGMRWAWKLSKKEDLKL